MTDSELDREHEEIRKKKQQTDPSDMYQNMAAALSKGQQGQSGLSSVGGAMMASGNPYAMAAGGAMQVVGAYADEKKRHEDEVKKNTISGLGNLQKLIMGAPRA